MRKTIRSLIQNAPYSIAVILTLTLVIGATGSLFTIIDAVLLKPLPYRNPAELVFLSALNQDASGKLNEYTTSVTNLLDWRERTRSFQSIAALQPDEMGMTQGTQPRQVLVGRITANLFDTLGVTPYRGRFFQTNEETDSQHVAILSYSLWTDSFGRSEQPRGLVLDGVMYEIVGVAPPEFFFGTPAQVWVPLNLAIPRSPRTSVGFLQAVGRMKRGVSVSIANSEIQRVAAELTSEFPASHTGWGARAHDMKATNTRNVRPVLFILAAGVLLLLLIGCVNVANLSLARAVAKQNEVAIQIALGASRKHLFLQSFTENLVLTLTAGLLGLVLTIASIRPIVLYSPLSVSLGRTFRIADSISLDWRAFLLIMTLSILISVVLSLLTGLRSTQNNLLDELHMQARGSTANRKRSRMRDLMVVSEIAMACILLTAAGAIVQQFRNLNRINPGFAASDRICFRITMPSGRYDTHEKRALFTKQAREKLASVPGFRFVGASTRLPLNEFVFTTIFNIEGRPPAHPGEGLVCNFRRIGSGYFKAAGIALLQGREFQDLDATSAPVAIVSREFEKRYWPGQSAIGKRILRVSRTDNAYRTIIGVVEDVKETTLWDPPQPTLYVPYSQGSIASIYFVISSANEIAIAKPAIESAIWSIDRNLPIADLKAMKDLYADSLSRPRFTAYLISIFAIAGLLLTSIGVFGTVSYSIHQRQQEIGIRMAMGSQPKQIRNLLLLQGFTVASLGMLYAVLGTLMLSQLIRQLDYSSNAGLLNSFFLSAGFNLFLWLIASALPIRRASKLDPMTVLR